VTAPSSLLTPAVTTWPSSLVVAPYRPGVADEIAGLLRTFGAVKLTGMTDPGDLVPLAERLGEIFLPILSPEDVAPAKPADSQIYEVRVKNSGEGELDRYGETILSTVGDDFALHTDGYNQPQPPRYMLLLRTDRSPELPTTYLADGVSLIQRLSPDELHLLNQQIYPTAEGRVPALSIRDGRPVLRWNAQLVQRWAARVESDTEALARAIDIVNRHLSEIVLTDYLHYAQCLILDNDRWLHGRSALQPDSTRVLQRAWVGG
jgi:alpha-ketoglutarate-dependent taurine dioxygenase